MTITENIHSKIQRHDRASNLHRHSGMRREAQARNP
jgi:hypothetical protein